MELDQEEREYFTNLYETRCTTCKQETPSIPCSPDCRILEALRKLKAM